MANIYPYLAARLTALELASINKPVATATPHTAGDPTGKTTLHYAAAAGQLPQGTTVQDLANAKDNNGYSALHTAALYGQLSPDVTAQELANAKDANGRSALHEAAISGYLPPNTTAHTLGQTKDNKGRSALHTAALSGNLPSDTTVQDLAHTKDNTGRSALHAAALSGKLPAGTTAQDLATAKDNDGISALDLARERATHNPQLAQLLHTLEQAKPQPKIAAPATPTHQAEVPLVIRNPNEVHNLASIKDDNGNSYFHHAAIKGIVPEGVTAAQLAAMRNHAGVTPLHILLANKPSPQLQTTTNRIGLTAELALAADHAGTTALQWAAMAGNAAAIPNVTPAQFHQLASPKPLPNANQAAAPLRATLAAYEQAQGTLAA